MSAFRSSLLYSWIALTFLKDLLIFILCVWMFYLHTCVPHELRASPSHKRALNLLELEFFVVKSSYMGIKSWSPASAASSNCWAISPGHVVIFRCVYVLGTVSSCFIWGFNIFSVNDFSIQSSCVLSPTFHPQHQVSSSPCLLLHVIPYPHLYLSHICIFHCRLDSGTEGDRVIFFFSLRLITYLCLWLYRGAGYQIKILCLHSKYFINESSLLPWS